MSNVQLPHPFSSIPREDLMYAHFPPISALHRLSATLFAGSNTTPTIYIKREDSNSPLAAGGNKIRKLEYVLPDALSAGTTTLVTTGGLQSNHMRQVAAVAARYGLKTQLLPMDVVESPDVEYKRLGNIQITHLLGATHNPYNTSKDILLEKLESNGEKPYFIPSGASTHPLGGLGFARFAFELAQQEREANVFFDTIILPCASGSTLGGLVAGFKLLETNSSTSRKRRLIGIDCMGSRIPDTVPVVLQIAQTTASKIGLSESSITADDVVIDRRWNAGDYGQLDETTEEAIKLLARTEGILLDPVYTGKAFAGLVNIARLGELEGSKNVLFIHTGGVPGLSAYPDLR